MNSETRLKLAIAVAIIFMLVEIVGGYFAHSLAIFADAAHLFSDIAGFVLALFALIISRKPKSLIYTFGYGRAEILGALFSIGLLWMVTIYLVFEAFFRAIDWFEGKSPMINGEIMFGTAVFGIFVNLVLIVVFHEEHEQNVLHGCQHGSVDEAEGNVGAEMNTACHDGHNHHHTDHHNHEHSSHSNHIELSPMFHSTATPFKPSAAIVVAPSTLSSSAAVFTPMRTMTTSTTLQPISTIGKATPANNNSNTTGGQQQRYMKMDDFDEEISPLPASAGKTTTGNSSSNMTTPINSSSHHNDTNSNNNHHNNSHDHSHHHDGDNNNNNSCCYGDHYQPHSNNSNDDSHHSNCNHHNHHDHHSLQSPSAVINITKTAKSHDHDHSHSHSHSHSGHGNHGHDSNMKAAALHVMTDMIQSIGVAIAGAVVWYKPQWQIVDPICTLLFSILVLHSTLPLASTLVVTLMEAVPCHIDCARVESSLRAVRGVTEVGSLRIWSVSTHRSAATAHIQVTSAAECARVLLEAHRVCHDEYGISYVTLQVQAMPLSIAAADDSGDNNSGNSSHNHNNINGNSNSSMNQQKRECPWVCDHV